MGTSRYWIVCGVSMALALGGAMGSATPVAGAEPIANLDSQVLSQLDAASLEAVNLSEPVVDQQQPLSGVMQSGVTGGTQHVNRLDHGAQTSTELPVDASQSGVSLSSTSQHQPTSVTLAVMQAAMSASIKTILPNHGWVHLQLAQTGTSSSGASPSDAQPLRFSQDPIPVVQPLPGLVPEQTRPATVTTPSSSVPIADPTRPYTPPPDYLNPVANPLQFPTKPEEVTLAGTQPITLAQALDLARRNSRSLQVVELQLQSSRLAVREARAAELPSVNFNGTVSYTDSATTELSNRRRDPNPLAALLGQQNQSTTSSSLSGTIEVTYSLDTSGGRSAAIAAAERQLRINELEYERQLEALRLDVTTDYYALQEADQQVEIARQAVRNAEQSLRDAKALEEAGVGTRFDVLRSEVQLANAKQDLVRAISTQRISRRQLAQRLSIPQSIDIAAADPVAIAGLWSLSLEDSIIMAFKNRPELEQQLAQRELSEKQRDLALASIRPQVSLFANYSVLDQFDDNIGSADGYAIGARVNWTLYDGGASVARAQQRERDIEIAETRFADIRNQIRFQVEQAYSNLQANFENIQTAALAVEQAEESLRLARLRFQAGVGTQTEVINAETELTRAQVNRLRAILDYNRALASLQRAISNLAAGNNISPASN